MPFHKNCTPPARPRCWPRISLIAAAASLALGTAQAAMPAGAQVTSGSATITRFGDAMFITQRSQRATINWRSFSIGSGGLVKFNQPSASSVTLNRVVGTDESRIDGQLRANGQVFLVNPNGVFFSSTAQVRVGGLLASTRDISDADFKAGAVRYTRDGNGDVTNKGSIQVAPGGTATLVGKLVMNTGEVLTPQGFAELVARAPAGSGAAQVINTGKLEAAGGAISLQAQEGSVVNLGTIRSDGPTGGSIAIAADHVQNNGLLSARGTADAGGVIQVNTFFFSQASAGVMDAGGSSRGGSITLDARLGQVTNFGTVRSDGATGGSIAMTAGQFQNSGLLSAAGTAGAGGDIVVNALRFSQGVTGTLDVGGSTRGGTISVQAPEGQVLNAGTMRSDGAMGGSIAIAAEQVRNDGLLSARGSAGRGGEISVDAVRISQGEAGAMDVQGSAGGGSVLLNAPTGPIDLAGTLAALGTAGTGGTIGVDAGTRLALNGVRLLASGAVGGGKVTLSAGELAPSGTNVVEASATQNGQGGLVQVGYGTVSDAGSSTRLVARGAGQGRDGMVKIDAGSWQGPAWNPTVEGGVPVPSAWRDLTDDLQHKVFLEIHDMLQQIQSKL